MKNRIAALLILACLSFPMAGCGATSAVTSTSSPAAVVSVSTEVRGPAIGVTVARPATTTPQPHLQTSTPEPSLTPLPTLEPKIAGSATPPVLGTLSPIYLDLVGQSPDGEWFWALEEAPGDPNAPWALFYAVHLVKADGSVDWYVTLTPDYFTALDRVPMEGQSYNVFYWLSDDPYVYLVASACCADGEIYYLTGFNMVRLNLETGQITTQVPGWSMHYFLFAKTGRYLLDAPLWDNRLLITCLRDGQVTEITLPMDYYQSGRAAFRADNKLLAVQSCVREELRGCVRFPLSIVDIEAKTHREVVPDLLKALGIEKFIETKTSWVNDTQVLIEEVPIGDEIPRRWIVDLVTGDVTAQSGGTALP